MQRGVFASLEAKMNMHFLEQKVCLHILKQRCICTYGAQGVFKLLRAECILLLILYKKCTCTFRWSFPTFSGQRVPL